MRILGRVSVSAQCIHDGVSSGAFQIKANVILDLAKNLDTECVAGSKMAAQLKGDSPPSAPSTPRATPPPGRVAFSPAPSVPAAETPRTPPPASSRPSTRPPSSPPGFPTPRYPASPGTTTAATIPVLRVAADGHQMSPRSANIRALTIAFNNADRMQRNVDKGQKKVDDVIEVLEDLDPDGEIGDDGYDMTFHLTNGLHYHYNHGRDLCAFSVCTNRDQYAEYGHQYQYPSNCGFNQQWHLPDKFRPCGPRCQGGFCHCHQKYKGEGKR